MSNVISGDRPVSSPLPVSRFWQYYLGGQLRSMARDRRTGYMGTLIEPPPKSMDFAPGNMVAFDIKRTDLLRYDYAADPKFSLGVYDKLNEALVAVVSAPLMQRDAIPHVDQLELALRRAGQAPGNDQRNYDALRKQAVSALTQANITIDEGVETVRALMPSQADYENYKSTGEVAKLHADRELLFKAFAQMGQDARMTGALRDVIDGHEREDVMTIQIAVWALGRQNDKGSIAYLIGLLAEPRLAVASRAIERALQFISSGQQLVPLADESPENHWRKCASQLPNNLAGWAVHDAQSVFWEKRLRCAVEWKTRANNPAQLEWLQGDEVLPVRLAAGGPEKMDS